MALRVLLADESSTIKKVMMLALSDFGVEVKSVPVGLDVLAVTKTFKPDIVFADVLLTKRNGYEVSGDLKNDPETTNIPVVLMWSGFMEIDEAKAQDSRADRRLEKPFDADHLRNIVQDLVIKTKSNPVSSYLNFPDMPAFEETPDEGPAAEIQPLPIREGSYNDPIYAIPEEESEGFTAIANIPSIDEDENPLDMPADEEFSSVPLTTTPKSPDEMDEGGWAHQDLTKFKIQLPETEAADFASKYVIPQDDLSNIHIEESSEFEEITFDKGAKKPAAPQQKSPPPPPPSVKETAQAAAAAAAPSAKDRMMETLSKGPSKSADNNQDMMEKIVREEAREVIESVCWKLLPEIAERIVREEINKILRDSEKSI
jgi:FOG: CheY-like receiver